MTLQRIRQRPRSNRPGQQSRIPLWSLAKAHGKANPPRRSSRKPRADQFGWRACQDTRHQFPSPVSLQVMCFMVHLPGALLLRVVPSARKDPEPQFGRRRNIDLPGLFKHYTVSERIHHMKQTYRRLQRQCLE